MRGGVSGDLLEVGEEVFALGVVIPPATVNDNDLALTGLDHVATGKGKLVDGGLFVQFCRRRSLELKA